MTKLRRLVINLAALGLLAGAVAFMSGQGPSVHMYRLCARQGYNPPINCHPNIPAAASKANLAAYTQEVQEWATRTQSQTPINPLTRPPTYWPFALRFSDRVEAEKIRAAADDDYQGWEARDLKQGIATGRYHYAAVPPSSSQNPKLSTLSEPMANANAEFRIAKNIGLSLLVAFFAVAFACLIPGLAVAVRRAQLQRQGYVDTHARHEKQKAQFTNIGGLAAIVIFITCVVLHAVILGIILASIVFIAALVTHKAVWDENPDRMGGVPSRFQRPRPPPIAPKGEQGTARHAAEDDLLAKGFAESDGPSDAEMAAGLSAMTQAERDAFAKKAGAVITRKKDGSWAIREKGVRQ